MADNNNKTDREIWEEHEKALKEKKKAEKAAAKKAAEEAKAAKAAEKEAEKKTAEAAKEAERKAAEEAKVEKQAAAEAGEKAENAVGDTAGAAAAVTAGAAASAAKEGKQTTVRLRKGVKKTVYAEGNTVRIQKIKKNNIKKKLIVFIILACALLFISIFARQLCPYDPYKQDLSQALQAPSGAHLLGTDRYGRDQLSRIIMGSQASIYSTLLLVAIVSVIGTIFGIICGWKGGKVDAVLMRISDVFLAFPELVFALAVAGVLGGGVWSAIFAMAAVARPKYARIARSQTLAQKETPFMAAAKLSGNTTGKLIFRHILPNILGPLLVTAMLDIGTMMMGLSGLSYLGLGVMPPTAEWGSMMSESRSMLQLYPWITLSPGVAIFISVMIFNLLGDTVRDYLDPKQRTK